MDADDVEYLLGAVNHAFPSASAVLADVTSCWAGVRLLVASEHAAAGTPSNVSRTHEIRMPESGWLDVAGGKLTTYRLIAEQDRVMRFTGGTFRAGKTGWMALAPDALSVQFSGVLPPPVCREIVRHCCESEWARRLDDLMDRRTWWSHYPSRPREFADQVSVWMAGELGWSERQRAAELDRFVKGSQAGQWNQATCVG